MEKKTVFPNKLRVVTEKLPDFYSVSIGVWVKVGSRHELQEENGVSHFIEHMFFKGTNNRNARDIALAIESVGGMINAFTSKEYTCFYTKVLKDDVPLAVDILSDIFFACFSSTLSTALIAFKIAFIIFSSLNFTTAPFLFLIFETINTT